MLETNLLNYKSPDDSKIESIIKAHSKTFSLASGLFPPAKRTAIRALYAFCRVTDDLADQHRATRLDIEDWRMCVRRPINKQDPAVLKFWKSVRQRYAINPRYEDELIDGIAMDVDYHRYKTWEDLQSYCYHVASTVGLLSIPIIGLAPGACLEDAEPYAIKLGIALQLTNILRDIGEDARNGRIYLPKDDLSAFGLSEEDVYKETVDQRFINLVKFEMERARSLYVGAFPGIAFLHKDGRFAVAAAARLYAGILDEIEKIQYQVYKYRAHVSSWRKLQMLPAIYNEVRRLKFPGYSST
jgi:phytoene synthase